MKIEVLGTGCKKCISMTDTVKEAVSEMGVEAEVVKVEDIKKIMQYGVMSTPAIVVDGVVKVAGKMLSKAEVIALLK